MVGGARPWWVVGRGAAVVIAGEVMGGAASEGLRCPRPTDGPTEVFGVVEELMGGLSPPHKAMWCGKKRRQGHA